MSFFYSKLSFSTKSKYYSTFTVNNYFYIMDYEYPKEINGINLADYYPNQRSYNSVVYVRKKILEKAKKQKKKEIEKKQREVKEKRAKSKSKLMKCEKCDKCQQCEKECNNDFFATNNSMLTQGFQFTRTMIPVVIPPSGIASPVYYTIKATKKNKDKNKPKPEVSAQTHTLKKEKSKRVIETYRNEKGKESLSVRETISYSSQSDTLDELQINPSLCCTFSEISDHKNVKKGKRVKPKQEFQKVITSESFEALATEFLNTSGDTKIKIHLMNETEKNLLSENIRVPVLNAIRECILEVNSQRHNESNTVQKFVRCNNQKLDNIIDKLTGIEQKLDNFHTDYNTKAKAIAQEVHNENIQPKAVVKQQSPEVKVLKAPDPLSTLEQLGEDILELVQNDSALERPESSGDEYYSKLTLSARKKLKGKSAVVQLEAGNKQRNEGLGGGEETNMYKPSSSQNSQLIRPDKPGRIPARFCWTDAARKNAVT